MGTRSPLGASVYIAEKVTGALRKAWNKFSSGVQVEAKTSDASEKTIPNQENPQFTNVQPMQNKPTEAFPLNSENAQVNSISFIASQFKKVVDEHAAATAVRDQLNAREAGLSASPPESTPAVLPTASDKKSATELVQPEPENAQVSKSDVSVKR